MKCNETPLIVLVLMVKNEAHAIQTTLASYIEAGIHHFLLLDTGSTDATVVLARDFFHLHSVTAYIHQEPFVDFAYSRNQALILAEEHFLQATFFMMPDAEWHLRHGHELIQFCEQEKNKAPLLYLITIIMNGTEFTTARLFRASARIRFKGVVHEAPTEIATVKAPAPIHFEVMASSKGIEKSKQRWERDLVLLTNAWKKNPNDPRTVFYLAQTYECLERLEEAYQYYLQRSCLQGWDEENFITLFRLGCVVEKLSQKEDIPRRKDFFLRFLPSHSNPLSWDNALHYFLQAFALRAHRIEPLIQIANHYWPDNAQACYLYVKHAYEMPYPENDMLFIEKKMYLYDRYEIMSRCAWYVGNYELGQEATLKALNYHPEMPHLLRNLELYQEKLESLFA